MSYLNTIPKVFHQKNLQSKLPLTVRVKVSFNVGLEFCRLLSTTPEHSTHSKA